MGQVARGSLRKNNTLMITRCGGYTNVPLLGTQGAINYNPELTSRQAGYPMVRAPLQEVLTPLLLEGSQAHRGEHHQKRGRVAN
ncbi:hypothetical protein CR513_04291, partial [Mucuna pruriens]